MNEFSADQIRQHRLASLKDEIENFAFQIAERVMTPGVIARAVRDIPFITDMADARIEEHFRQAILAQDTGRAG